MKSTKLYFSDKSEQTREGAISRVIELLADVGFPGETITRTVGVWKGETEPGFVCEVLRPTVSPYNRTETTKLQTIAGRLASEYSQESVLLTEQDVDSTSLVLANGNVYPL